MNFHNITHCDMLNGEGLRVVLWVSGCSHCCDGCQNPETWDINSGIEFDQDAEDELFYSLAKDYINGITFSGGDPFHPQNRAEVLRLANKVKTEFEDKDVWVYTGYNYEDLKDEIDLSDIDVLVDGEFIKELKDENLEWVGSSNQRVIRLNDKSIL